MQWMEISIDSHNRDIDSLCLLLGELGVSGMVIEDEQDFRRFLENNRQYWDYVDEDLEKRFKGKSRVKFYLGNDQAGKAIFHRISKELKKPMGISYMDDDDWGNSWRQYYEPIEVGERLLIVPEWVQAPTGDRIILRLDPGLSFGTGSHATTRMCLEILEKHAHPQGRVLDLGCGSGILGIAALLLGCESVFGCDIDPASPQTARANARLNGLDGPSFSVISGDLLKDEALWDSFDKHINIILANIVADVIIPLSPRARKLLAPGGLFICSGIIQGRQEEVKDALQKAGFDVSVHLCQEDWHSFQCVVRG